MPCPGARVRCAVRLIRDPELCYKKGMSYLIRSFTTADIQGAHRLWSGVEGLKLGDADTAYAIERFLRQNPGFSAVAVSPDEVIIGAVLCGHNGREGCLYHLAVAEGWRRRGVGRDLVEHCQARLAAADIRRCKAFVYTDNEEGNAYWAGTGWIDPPDWKVLYKRF